MDKIFVRTDADEDIGTGHAIRCLALSQEVCSRGRDVTFFMKSGEELVQDHASLSALTVRSISSELEFRTLVKRNCPDWVVLDHYELTADLEKELRTTTNVLTIDDYAHRDDYDPSILLNQNISAKNTWYTDRGLEEDRILLGPEYVLLREQFLQTNRNNPGEFEDVDKIVVTLGGGDQNEMLDIVLISLNEIAEKFESIHVLGDEPSRKSYSEQFTFHSHVTDMATFLSGMDLAVSGGGSTLWELLYLGIPTISVILAENQRYLVEQLHEKNVLISYFTKKEITPDALRRTVEEALKNQQDLKTLISQGKNLVDGRGSKRVFERMSSLVDG